MIHSRVRVNFKLMVRSYVYESSSTSKDFLLTAFLNLLGDEARASEHDVDDGRGDDIRIGCVNSLVDEARASEHDVDDGRDDDIRIGCVNSLVDEARASEHDVDDGRGDDIRIGCVNSLVDEARASEHDVDDGRGDDEPPGPSFLHHVDVRGDREERAHAQEPTATDPVQKESQVDVAVVLVIPGRGRVK